MYLYLLSHEALEDNLNWEALVDTNWPLSNNMVLIEWLQYTVLRIQLKLNTALLSTFRPCVRSSQAWHLNFSQLFDDLGHENHVFSDGM